MLEIEKGTIDRALAINALIPEFQDSYDRKEFEKRLSNVEHQILIANLLGKDVGFKIAYAREGHLYSWLGGILPKYRRQGIARALSEQQEEWAKTRGYPYIKMKTWNARSAMLIFALGNGFKIVGFEEREDIDKYRIYLKKDLK